MSITTQQYDSIVRFLDADMTLEEMEDFEVMLTQYPEMRDQLMFEQQLRDKWAEKPPEVGAAKTLVSHRKSRQLIAIAAVLILGIFGLYLLIRTRLPEPVPVVNTVDSSVYKEPIVKVPAIIPSKDNKAKWDRLFITHFSKDSVIEDSPILLADALIRYENNDYNAILQIDLNSLPIVRGQSDDRQAILQWGHYYKGIAYLITGDAQHAIPHLQWVVRNNEKKEPGLKAQHYLALAYLKAEEPLKAKEQLSLLLSTGLWKGKDSLETKNLFDALP